MAKKQQGVVVTTEHRGVFFGYLEDIEGEGEEVSRWTHAICEDCWLEREPNKQPCQLTNAADESCCYCGKTTVAGIYVRGNPAETKCRGEGGTHSEQKAGDR